MQQALHHHVLSPVTLQNLLYCSIYITFHPVCTNNPIPSFPIRLAVNT